MRSSEGGGEQEKENLYMLRRLFRGYTTIVLLLWSVQSSPLPHCTSSVRVRIHFPPYQPRTPLIPYLHCFLRFLIPSRARMPRQETKNQRLFLLCKMSPRERLKGGGGLLLLPVCVSYFTSTVRSFIGMPFFTIYETKIRGKSSVEDL